MVLPSIDAASPGDIIKIPGGTYVETVNDHKGITFSPGSNPDCVIISGNLTVTPTTTFDMDIWGETVCDDYDQIEVTGYLDISDSSLNIILDGFIPELGDQFIIFTYGTLTGEFDDILVGNPGVEFTISYGDLSTASEIILTTSSVPPPIPLSNWAFYFTTLQIGSLLCIRIRKIL